MGNSEAELVQQTQRGDAQAFGQLYEIYAGRVYGYLAARVRNGPEAEDLMADTFVKALKQIGTYRPGQAPFGAWLFRIAHNTLVDHWRRDSRRPTVPWEERDAQDHAAAGEMVRIVERADIDRGLAQLTELQQQAVTLRFLAGCSLAETAQIMRKSEEAVKDLQHNALAALRKRFQPA